jgi:hypothetical protein
MPQDEPISFDLSHEHLSALKTIAGNRPVRLMGRVEGNKMKVTFVACNAAFVACNAAFTACNAAFTKSG